MKSLNPLMTVQCSPRMSFTFRSLRPASSAQSAPSAPRTRSSQPSKPCTKQQHPGQKRVLILSDSKNRQFDCSLFRSPRMTAERKNLFLLRDLREHRDAISKADIVLISAGVNDLRRTRVRASTLVNHCIYVTSHVYSREHGFSLTQSHR